MRKIALIKAPYTVREHLDGAASLHIGHIMAMLKNQNLDVKYFDYNNQSFYLWSQMMLIFVDKMIKAKDTEYLLPSEALMLLERAILEKEFGPSESDLLNFIPITESDISGLSAALNLSLNLVVEAIHEETQEVIIFVSPTIFFPLVLIKIIKKKYPNIIITVMDEFTFEPAVPYFYFILTGKGIYSENFNDYYKYDKYNYILKLFILENVSNLIIGEGYDYISNETNFKNEKIEMFGEMRIYWSQRMDLDTLPFPCFDGMNEIYVSAEIEFSRGCLYNCEFCERTRFMKNQIFQHSPDYIIKELEYLKKYNFGFYTVIDCSVNLNEEYMIEVLTALHKHNIEINYQCNLRGKKPNMKLLKLLKETGCFEIAFGIETMDNKILQDMNKIQDIQIIQDLIEAVNQFDMKLMLFLILGFPTEKRTSVLKTINYIVELNKKVVIDVIELEIYHPGILQRLNPSRYQEFNIVINSIDNNNNILESSLCCLYPGMYGAMTFERGMSRQEIKSSLIDYIRICKNNGVNLETFFGNNLVEE